MIWFYRLYDDDDDVYNFIFIVKTLYKKVIVLIKHDFYFVRKLPYILNSKYCNGYIAATNRINGNKAVTVFYFNWPIISEWFWVRRQN